jgi:HAD superfamily hydrolase (TIGR01662 family)
MDLYQLTVEDCVVNSYCYSYTKVPQKYLFFDLDGTVRRSVDNSNPKPGYAENYSRRPPFIPEEVEIFSKIIPKLIEWLIVDYKLIGITNQSGVQEGAMTFDTCFRICHETAYKIGMVFPIIFAPCKTGNPDIVNLRKPNTGMIDLAESLYGPIDRDSSLLVGDYKTDIQTGEAAGLKTFKVNAELEGKDFPLP